MIVVVFEFSFNEGQAQRYFDLVAELKPELEKIDGFISVERFSSLTTPGKYVSVQLWRDEAAVLEWRRHAGHRIAQMLGKREIFADYRLTIGETIRSYTLADRRRAETGETAAPTGELLPLPA